MTTILALEDAYPWHGMSPYYQAVLAEAIRAVGALRPYGPLTIESFVGALSEVVADGRFAFSNLVALPGRFL